MSYRLLRIARGDKTDLPGFDQDIFIANTTFDEVAVTDLIKDFQAVRQATRRYCRRFQRQLGRDWALLIRLRFRPAQLLMSSLGMPASPECGGTEVLIK